jgi:hypothetical protein
VPRAFFAKDKAQRVGVRLNGDLRVVRIRDAANFDPGAHFPLLLASAPPKQIVNRKS